MDKAGVWKDAILFNANIEGSVRPKNEDGPGPAPPATPRGVDGTCPAPTAPIFGIFTYIGNEGPRDGEVVAVLEVEGVGIDSSFGAAPAPVPIRGIDGKVKEGIRLISGRG